MDSGEHRTEQLLRDCNLSHLKDGRLGVGDYPNPYLYELQLDAGEGPVRYLFGQGGAAHEVAEIVHEHEQGETHPVAGETGYRNWSGATEDHLERSYLERSREMVISFSGYNWCVCGSGAS